MKHSGMVSAIHRLPTMLDLRCCMLLVLYSQPSSIPVRAFYTSLFLYYTYTAFTVLPLFIIILPL